ncbi:MAG: PGDYG domain-containing protein [Nevskia sp.]|nr:PGDYG domain-containing protein [Nevskia sp.]
MHDTDSHFAIGPDWTHFRLELNPCSLLVRKLALPIEVRFAHYAGILQTLEGPNRYEANAAICTGVLGECWPMRIDEFMDRYRVAGPQQMGQDGLYVPLPRTTWACRVSAHFHVRSGFAGQRLLGQAGDWLVWMDKGCGVVARRIFEATYEILLPR